MSAPQFGSKQSPRQTRLECLPPTFEFTAKRLAGEALAVQNQIWMHGGLTVSCAPMLAARVVRTKTNPQHDQAHDWVLTYCRKSAAAGMNIPSLEQAASAALTWSPGKMVKNRRGDVEWVQLLLPRDTFSDLAPLLDTACWSVLDTPLGHLLGEFMLALKRRLPTISKAEKSRLNRALGTLVAACIAPSVPQAAAARSQIDSIRMGRVRQAVHARLRFPTLNPTTLCRAVGLSRSSLYRLFEGHGGVARFIQEQRLLAAHAALCDVADRQSIYAIATELCFASPSTFSRAFRQEFGHSPSEIRAAALIRQAPRAISQRR